MKANEAPEKIYVQLPSRNWIGRTWNEKPIKEGDNPNWKNATNIEYTRTDVFIEKALAYLNEKFYFNNLHYAVENNTFSCMEEMFEDFKNYMKGE